MNREEQTLIEKIEGNRFLTATDRQILIDRWKDANERLQATESTLHQLDEKRQEQEKRINTLETALIERDQHLERKEHLLH